MLINSFVQNNNYISGFANDVNKKMAILPEQKVNDSASRIEEINFTFKELNFVRKYYPMRSSIDTRYSLLFSIRVMLDSHFTTEERQHYDEQFKELLHQKIMFSTKGRSQFISASDMLDMELRRWFHEHKDKLVR